MWNVPLTALSAVKYSKVNYQIIDNASCSHEYNWVQHHLREVKRKDHRLGRHDTT